MKKHEKKELTRLIEAYREAGERLEQARARVRQRTGYDVVEAEKRVKEAREALYKYLDVLFDGML